MILNCILGAVAVLSLALILWQWAAARRFPLHHRAGAQAPAQAVTLLKPLKGADEHTATCLRSWLRQVHPAPVQTLFAVSSPDDPACAVVNELRREFPHCDTELVVCDTSRSVNAKVAKLMDLEPRARHGVLVVSDADVRVPPDFLANLVAPLARPEVGLVNCLYRLANPVTAAMRWEAVAINADFWSQVLQGATLRPVDFALGAAMAVRREALAAIGGFSALRDYLADDYQLGHQLARAGWRILLCPVVAECWDPPKGWRAVWAHQLRWARTIRVCRPLPYFFSVLANGAFWPLLWLVAVPSAWSAGLAGAALLARLLTAVDLQRRLTQQRPAWKWAWMVFAKDLLQVAVWLLAFLGNTLEWRGVRYRLRRDGRLERVWPQKP